MKLQKLTQVQLEFALIQRARGFKAKEVAKLVASEFPGVHRYAPVTYRDYFKSDEGQAEIVRVQQGISQEALERGFARQGDRLDLLNEMVERHRQRLRDLEATDEDGVRVGTVKEINDVSAELRQVLSTLHKEMDPLADTREAVAPVVAFFEKLQKHKEAQEAPVAPETVQ